MTVVSEAPTAPARQAGAPGIAMRVVLAGLGLTSVAPLLAWVFELGSFRGWFLAVTVPGAVALVVLVVRRGASVGVRRVITVGVVAGLIGTLGYDVFRIPFVFGAGYNLLSPIESYGVVLTGSSTSSGWTDVAGWAWHFSNGIGFGVAYVAIAEGRTWRNGVAWAMVLESASVFTPFALYYNLTGKLDVIAIAYAAHLPFGMAVGWFGQHSEEIYRGLREMTGRPNLAVLGATAVALVVWLQPTVSHRLDAAPESATVAIQDGQMHPEFVRVGEGGCATFANLDSEAYDIPAAMGPGVIAAHGTGEFCFNHSGVHRLRIDGRPFHGGFVIVDPAMAAEEEP